MIEDSRLTATGPETIDRAIIGTTRRLNPHTNTLEWSRLPTSKIKNPHLDPDNRESVLYRIHPALEKGKLIYQMNDFTLPVFGAP